jgi:hypothetical protein
MDLDDREKELVEETLLSLSRQIDLFERAAQLDGRSREKLVALQEAEEIFFRQFPHQYRALQTIRVASQLNGAGDWKRDPVRQCESRLISLLMRIILEGLSEGDLHLRTVQRPAELAFTIWSLAFGARALMNTGVATRQLGIKDGFRVARDATTVLLDALKWKPLSDDWDYDLTRDRARNMLCPPEQPRPSRNSKPAR